jgi:hypothetical protein
MMCAEVIRYLYRARYPFIMPVVRHGRAANDPRGPSGTNVFATLKCSGWYTSTLTTADKQTATVLICVHCRNGQGQRGRQGRQTLVYTCWYYRQCRPGTSALTITGPTAFANGVNLELL